MMINPANSSPLFFRDQGQVHRLRNQAQRAGGGALSAHNNSGESKKAPAAGKFQDILNSTVASSRQATGVDPETDIKGHPERKRLWETSQEMESLFVKMMFDSMRKAVPKTKWIGGGRAEEIFQDMLYDRYSLEMARNEKLGLAENIYRQMRDSVK